VLTTRGSGCLCVAICLLCRHCTFYSTILRCVPLMNRTCNSHPSRESHTSKSEPTCLSSILNKLLSNNIFLVMLRIIGCCKIDNCRPTKVIRHTRYSGHQFHSSDKNEIFTVVDVGYYCSINRFHETVWQRNSPIVFDI
jgi:hypothetical protein